ncbi:unnamed protein product [Phyllotreta striolata]|uniref:NADH dehydrogenase [ubiquinone] iron-sulfur protein 5 n=1 Tax=Phyllotreta striolata TaxID=444603 RepID=A0A9N9TT59_PHYSR|nr:unnamed protein product [Phyllotreta striolata]
MSVSPWLKSPFTDLTGALVSHQWYGKCADLELKVMDCLEAHGLNKGVQVCKDIMDDFKECAYRAKQQKRYTAMVKERERQYAAGERTKEDRYAPGPPTDSY